MALGNCCVCTILVFACGDAVGYLWTHLKVYVCGHIAGCMFVDMLEGLCLWTCCWVYICGHDARSMFVDKLYGVCLWTYCRVYVCGHDAGCMFLDKLQGVCLWAYLRMYPCERTADYMLLVIVGSIPAGIMPVGTLQGLCLDITQNVCLRTYSKTCLGT